MAFYKSPADMFDARAKRSESDGKRNWAKAKNGDGDGFYGKAKKNFADAERNRQLAESARKNNLTWKKGK